ncbi:MAG TPA: DUF5069 domain-containing protein [Solirubrobacteraceae bacterium]|jgi:quercetin dioxygenase-like cupin family protein
MTSPDDRPGVAAAPDLRTGEARPLDAELDGYAWLPRMLDKARATLAGTNGSYLFGCPVDHTCMARLGVAPDVVLDLAARHADDAGVLAELRSRGIPGARDAWFDAPAVEDELQTGSYLRVRTAGALPERDGGRAFLGAEHGARVSLVLVDAAPGEAEAPHRHPVEELMVVQSGAALYQLGALQRRIVRAGEVVRVPAGVEHFYASAGDVALRAVRVHGDAEIATDSP